MRNAFYVKWLDILVTVFWFSFNVMYLCENNLNEVFCFSACFSILSENEKVFAQYEKRFFHNE